MATINSMDPTELVGDDSVSHYQILLVSDKGNYTWTDGSFAQLDSNEEGTVPPSLESFTTEQATEQYNNALQAAQNEQYDGAHLHLVPVPAERPVMH